MTPLQNVLHKLGYDLSPDWSSEMEEAVRWAGFVLGKERVEWIASADNHFVFGDEFEDTQLIFNLTDDPVLLAAYGWHGGVHVSKRVPKLSTKDIKAAHIWYLLRSAAYTRREVIEMEERRGHRLH